MTRALTVALVAGLACMAGIAAAEDLHSTPALDTAQALFYDGRYAEATRETRASLRPEDQLAAYELRTSALLFQIRRAIGGDPDDKGQAFRRCAQCPALLDDFMREFADGRAAAKQALNAHPGDTEALFYLGKLDLNYVWLMLGSLGRRTGWNEYWEARHSLDAVLEKEPAYLRARVARAWIDYIVDTRMPWGTGWLLGGGNKKKALKVMREAAESSGDPYAVTEAMFGLWDMQVREKNFDAALVTARRLAATVPNNPEVARFIEARAH